MLLQRWHTYIAGKKLMMPSPAVAFFVFRVSFL
jgi:hypothetical protein